MTSLNRKSVAIVGAVALLVTVPTGVAVAKARQSNWGTINKIAVAERSGPASTSSKQWQDLALDGRKDMSNMLGSHVTVVAKGPMSATYTVDVTGGPVEFRLKNDGRTLRPSVVRMDPRPGDTTRSFTFVQTGGKAACRNLAIEWRSVSGAKVTSRSSSMAVTYDQPKKVRFGCA